MRKGIGIVDMEYGRVAGEEQNSITLFRGIPYAKPPVGELRWKAPQPAEPWEGVRECRRFRDMCIQNPVALKMALGGNPKGVYGPRGQMPMTRMGIAEVIRENYIKAKEYMEKKKRAKKFLSIREWKIYAVSCAERFR